MIIIISTDSPAVQPRSLPPIKGISKEEVICTHLAISPLASAQKGILWDLVPPMVTSRIWLFGDGGVDSCHAAIRARWKDSSSTTRLVVERFIVPN